MNGVLCFISGQELFIVFIFILLFFGAKKIPEIARGLGKGMKEFRKATEDIKKEINDQSGEVMDDINDIRKTLEK